MRIRISYHFFLRHRGNYQWVRSLAPGDLFIFQDLSVPSDWLENTKSIKSKIWCRTRYCCKGNVFWVSTVGGPTISAHPQTYFSVHCAHCETVMGQKRNKQKQGLLPAIVTEQQKCKHQLLETAEKSLFFQCRKLKVRSPVCIYNTFVKSETYRGCAPHM